MDNFLKELIVTSKEILEKIESLVMKIEHSIEEEKPIEDEIVHTLFREFHTIKGNSGFFGLPNIVNVAHTTESLLNDIRNKVVLLEQPILDFIIESKDFLVRGFELVERTNSDVGLEEESKFLKAKLFFLITINQAENKDKEDIESSGFGIFEDEDETKPQHGNNILPSFGIFDDEIETKPQPENNILPNFEIFDDEIETKPQPENNILPKTIILDDDIKPKSNPINISLSNFGTFEEEKEKHNPEHKININPDIHKKKTEVDSPGDSKSDIRINTSKIDSLIDSIGELVIAESLVTQNPEIKDLNLKNFGLASENLNKAVKFIQDISLNLRMLPIESIFQKMERLVRDLSKKINKKVSLETDGNDTEIDKNILEHIADPIMHIIRNSIDHGIETAEERIKNSKNEKATILLQAYQSGSEVIISISDDGKGLDREKILKKAKESGLLIKNENEYTDEEVAQLIFLPGFSTAEVVTDLSGRGVGMDVVRKNINTLNGEIFIESKKNKGTKINIHIPLTLAIIECMIAVNRNKYFIIPTIDIREVFNYNDLKISSIDERDKVINFRDKLIPIINFQSLIHNDKVVETNQEIKRYVIVVESKKNYLAIIFDDIIGYHPVVIKQMSELFSHLKEYNGCTILGNGDIGLILDIRYIVDKFQNLKIAV